MENIISLCKRRGFIFQGSEIYGGLAGTFDYGPLGVLLKKNIQKYWWDFFVTQRDDMYGIDAALLMNKQVWKASGHVDGFSDPLIEDVVTKKRYRVDHLLEENGIDPKGMTLSQMEEVINKNNILSPDGNKLSGARQFNMMFKTNVGSIESEDSISYLRPETAQGMFVNFKNVVDSMHPKLPFGLAQIGRAFRNEIAPRDFVFRTREFEQMEIEYFVYKDNWEEAFEAWVLEMKEWMKRVGIDTQKVHQIEIQEEDRAHYSKRTIDFEFDFPFGQKELYGLAYRTDYDLKKHEEASGTPLFVVDSSTGEKIVPHCIEPSFGFDRTVLAILTSAYTEEGEGEDKRIILKLPASIAPIKAVVSPLLKNKPELVEKAKEVFSNLKKKFGNVIWDDNGNIGKRYRRADEIGTPFCIVVDFDTLGETPALKDTITIRHRDTGEQQRLPLADLESFIEKSIQF